jgi:hypothetical protein
MSFVSKEIIPVLEEHLVKFAPQIADYLIQNSASIANSLIGVIEQKMKESKAEDKEND